MHYFLGELIGTGLLILLGDGVVANVLLRQSKAEGAGWIVVTFGWAMAVFVAVFCVGRFSDAHINPAVTIAVAMTDDTFGWSKALLYILAQMLGAMIGATLVWLHFRPHFGITENADAKLGVFCTAPAMRKPVDNFISEVLGTFVLIFAVLYMVKPDVGLGAIDALPVALVVLAIGLSLGGTTGYAINPARDLGPRIMHQLLPIPGKRDSDWGYAWIPVVAPLVGAALAVGVSALAGRP